MINRVLCGVSPDVVDVKDKYVYLPARNLVFGSLTRFPFWAALQVISQN
jgi:hypothetical protein